MDFSSLSSGQHILTLFRKWNPEKDLKADDEQWMTNSPSRSRLTVRQDIKREVNINAGMELGNRSKVPISCATLNVCTSSFAAFQFGGC